MILRELKIKQQTFGEALRCPGSAFLNTPFNGLMGMGFQELSTTNTVTPLMNLVSQELIPEAVFAFKLNPQGLSSGGQITLGGTDGNDYEGPINWLKVIGTIYWEVGLDSVVYGNQVVVGGSAHAVIDSGTSLIAVPSDTAEYLNSMLGGQATSSGLYVVECHRQSPNVDLIMGGHAFTLTSKEYILNYSGICISAFTSLDLPSEDGKATWVLGDVFIRKFYAVFDLKNRRIGLATAKH